MNVDFTHKLLIALIGIIGTISIYTYNNIADRMTAIHDTVEVVDRHLIKMDSSLQYLQKDVGKVEAKVKEHISWSRAIFNKKRNTNHSGGR